jgi:hypothetical protein
MEKKSLLFVLVVFLAPILAFSQEVDGLSWLEAEAGKVIQVKGDLSEGAPMADLSWAWNSSVACFPETQAQKFNGNHVLYGLDLPSYSELEITLIPDDKKANFSLYAYEVGMINDGNLVPNLSSCIRCEVDHKWDYKYRGQTQDHTRSVDDILAIRNPYQVVIGVVGAEGLATGGYTLQVKLNKR